MRTLSARKRTNVGHGCPCGQACGPDGGVIWSHQCPPRTALDGQDGGLGWASGSPSAVPDEEDGPLSTSVTSGPWCAPEGH